MANEDILTDAVDELASKIRSTAMGYTLEDVVGALAPVLSQVFAEISDAPEQADPFVDKMAAALKADIRKKTPFGDATPEPPLEDATNGGVRGDLFRDQMTKGRVCVIHKS